LCASLLVAASLVLATACEQPASTEGPASPATEPSPSSSLGSLPAGGTDHFGSPLPFLSAYERRLFARGMAVFNTTFTPATGLGPLFNASSCAECHEDPVPGAVGDEVERHASAFIPGACNDLSAIGGPVMQDSVTPALHDALHITQEDVPPEASATGHRSTPSILGFGLLDAVPDAEILALADPNDRNHDGVKGRPNRTADGRIGRFGRKAQVATLREFNAGAFIMEMGITNRDNATEQTIRDTPLPAGVDPTPEPEISQQDLAAADGFVRLLAPPRAGGSRLQQLAGNAIFVKTGCASCHVPKLVTGRNPLRALSHRVVSAYTDLLLHDMGPELADICLGQARPSDFRTEPLMGLHFKSEFLHDGRAESIEDAIEQHGGEATRARDRFEALGDRERRILLAFLSNL
jgi:CxxC motif-containing protein (DUF1111 family)